ncbi:hypothetical protein H0A36_03865 [Endozoicomonas sp. SM1973]|uniref:Uncharacterized protein n=1 Tax=Spartinivicinus marinus TaxID=2994442 RepID=A0A853I152_9GAMM|nr:hypothetical protein [Spartinivicinus marinus]MCX4029557.1 hypothetical protein [Spartinivicinus marinus]NYZ65132.1 hypothetical protein [Spartinivicinus marinus]
MFSIIGQLLQWTPLLASGYILNLVIAIAAITLGIPIGWMLAKIRNKKILLNWAI